VTEEMIKEAISKRFLEVIANRRGYTCLTPGNDLGVDLTFAGFVRRREAGRDRYLKSDKHIDVQLKCTCEKSAKRRAEHVFYRLDVKTYNDLVFRKGGYTPLILVLLVLPDDPDHWLNVTPSELMIRRGAYWYIPDDTAKVALGAKKTIRIPEGNLLSVDFFADQMLAHYGVAA
jgi:Domain of unknown function (DUF4365)